MSAASTVNQLGSSSGRSNLLARLIVALGVAIVGLEAASYVSGRYFTWDLRAGLAKAQNAGSYIGLYPGQQAKLAAAAANPSAPPARPATPAAYVGQGGLI